MAAVRHQFALWWALHRERTLVAAGLAVAAGVALLLAMLVGWTRGGEMITGRVVGFGLHESDTGTFPVAIVQLGNASMTIVLGRSHNCRIGDAITVRKRSTGLLSHYERPCRPPGAPA